MVNICPRAHPLFLLFVFAPTTMRECDRNQPYSTKRHNIS